MSINNNLKKIKENIPKEVTFVAVSKTKSTEKILEAYNSGQRNFGENKVQELTEKYSILPKDINWHMIGHLQTNKVKFIAPFISLIHSVDSFKLLNEINKRGFQNNRVINCLIQVHIATEKTKFGFEINEVQDIIKESKKLDNINVKGLMGMATFTDNTDQINYEFSNINSLYNKIKTKNINILSIGMSSDYSLAINNGSNMIRVGSAIFGKRK